MIFTLLFAVPIALISLFTGRLPSPPDTHYFSVYTTLEEIKPYYIQWKHFMPWIGDLWVVTGYSFSILLFYQFYRFVVWFLSKVPFLAISHDSAPMTRVGNSTFRGASGGSRPRFGRFLPNRK